MDKRSDLREFIKREPTQRVFAKVFDRSTIESVHALSLKGFFEEVEFVVSTGKEAHVFRARDKSGNFRAVKAYKVSTSNFHSMGEYISGDQRFRNVKKNKRDTVFAWTKKEFKNLQKATEAGANVPLPHGFMNNVLVMEFVGEKGEAAKTLKDGGAKSAEKIRKGFVEFMARMYNADLVHADLSEYNVLMRGKEMVFIDLGQAVLTSHPKAEEFFERDLRNVCGYLEKNGLKKTPKELRGEVKDFAEKIR